uniref:Thymidine phosphorylase n=1 Tax=Entomoneis paludosa TaxID=265537 RepID=A0A7S3DUA5_9STRA|mmetsp:Transcript_38208/g.79463  ORF Transcript_38208/g.79463 Transcript_38208/m.79463 type:complete len:500 (+) Transcript_38208:148-1647(+)
MTEPSPPSRPDRFDPVQIIRLRRYGRAEDEHSDAELSWFIQQYTAGAIPDYQMAAWLMACCFRPLSPRETSTLTQCMVDSTPGGPLVWPTKGYPPLVDKHSTGGVGDKVSLILAPLVASLGVRVPMIAGRGLGHTGGTIDKLESIPGFCATLDMEQFQTIVNNIGCCINAAGPELCPADRKMYALRDCTCTVECLPLQTASILCKKIAEHPDSIVLDVKYGNGAFQSTPEQAAQLATSMVQTGHAQGLTPTTAFLTQMHQPLGYAIGNWYEVQECLEIMQPWSQNKNTALNYDLIALVCLQAGQMLLQSGLPQYQHQSLKDLTQLAFDQLKSGHVLPKFCDMALAQGADPPGRDSLWYPDASQLYPGVDICATTAGHVTQIQTMDLGWMTVALGAGRKMAHESVDPYAGILLRVKLGQTVSVGDVLCTLYAPPDKITEAVQQNALACFVLEEENVTTSSPSSLAIVTHQVTLEHGVQELPWEELPTVFHELYPQPSASP